MTRLFSRFSVRTKLFVTSLIVTLIAMFAVGWYAYDRRQQAIDFLTTQMLSLTRAKAEDQLAAQAASQANQTESFLKTVKVDVSDTADYARRLLDEANVLGGGDYWNAREKLDRLASEQWDNANDEPGSVFVPSKAELTPTRIRELNVLKYLDFAAPNLLAENPDIVALYFIDPEGATLYYPNIDLAAVVGDYDPTAQSFYTIATPENDPDRNAVWTLPYQDPAGTGLIVTISQPVYDSQGKFRGVVGADVQLSKISQAVSNVRVGDTGYAFLIDLGGRVVGMPERAYPDFGLTPEIVPPNETPKQTILYKGSAELQDATDKMRRGGSGVATFKTADGVDHYIAYSKVPVANYSLGLVVPVSETTGQTIAAIELLAEQTRQATVTGLVLFVILATVAVVVVYFAARALTHPLIQLTNTAKQIAGGNLEAVAPVTTRDEIGTLATTFNSMTSQLRDIINSLETRVELRTAQIQASADVGRAAASILDPDDLLSQVVRLITGRFGFYYAAAFTVDPGRKWAVLREADGPGDVAWTLKKAGHRLELDGDSMVATAIRRRRPRVALDVDEETVRFANPLLPETRSEVALPLIAGDEVLGALDVQSALPAAFDEASTTTLQAMADQIAVALSNARQYRRERSRAQQTTGLVEATVELATLTEEDDVNARILELTLALLNADGATLWMPVEQSDQLELVKAAGGNLEALVGQRVQRRQGAVGEAYATNYTVRLDIEQARREAWLTSWRGEAQAMLVTPLNWHEQAVGVVTAVLTADKSFSDDDVSTAQLFAAQAAATLENTRLFNQVQSALAELSAVNKRLTGEAWQVHTRGASIVHEYRALSTAAAPASTALSVPVELRGQAIGLVTLEDEQPQRELTAEERSIVENVVQQMALALESARLFEQTQSALSEARRLAQREQLVNRIVGQLRGAVSVDEVLHIATQEMRQAVRATYATAKLTAAGSNNDGRGYDYDGK